MNKFKKIIRKTRLFILIKRLYRSVNYTYVYKLNGKEIKGLKIYHTRSENSSEKWMSELLSIILKTTKGTFMDVGVNIGQTLCQVKTIDESRTYIGFEPNPACNMFVQELIRVNNFQDVQIFPVGLFTDDTILNLDLYEDTITNSGGSLIKGYWEYRNIKPIRTLSVPLMKYETIIKQQKISDPKIIKIDVEGAEIEVLNSLEKVIINNNPIIIIEILSAESSENKLRIDRQEEILRFIKTKNYRLYRIIEGQTHNLEYLMPISYFDPYFDHNQCNYLFVPEYMDESVRNSFKIKETYNRKL